ncbi:putative dehydrogenase [Kribbella sp. VKM Ac-2527]|uniref:Putative dehydrogenase n=1 Tax=Kribbella caucasensis TaxID=2512215 RepID=A0A4R6KDQ9_9ACTN|nr:putative dehydrogenase [Kribbella sp. VKM Ac-2527]
MTEPPLHAVLIGFGNAGRMMHLPLLVAAGFEVSGVVATSAAAEARVREAGLPLMESLETVDGSSPDIVVVAVPDEAHEDMLHSALALKPRAVVVDKPVATSSAAAVRMTEAARSAGSVLVPFQNRRWDGDFLTMKGLIGDGSLGDLIRVTSCIARWTAAVGNSWRERSRPGLDGRLADLGSHLVDQLVNLLGPVDSVYAEVRAARVARGPNDDCFLALRHRSGVTSHAHMSAVQSAPVPRFLAQGRLGSCQVDGMDPQQEQLVAGIRPGSIGWGTDPSRPAAALTGTRTRSEPIVPGDWVEFYRLLRQHIQCAEPPPVLAEDAIQILRILEASQQSADERSIVHVD